MTKPTLFSARHFPGEQTLPEDTAVASAGLLQGGDSRSSADMMYSTAPVLVSKSFGGTAARTTIDLVFSTTMRAGSGAIWITDGAVQTVLDSAGKPSLRIVGATDTREVALSSLHFSGQHVLIDGIDLLANHGYSVVISPGALQSTASKSFAGVRTPGAVSFSTAAAPTGDTTGPTLDAIHLDVTQLKAGQDIPVTLTFSEKIATPSPAAFSTPHAELVDLHSEDGITWHGTLKASAAVAAVANAFTVDMSMIRDLAGNPGRGTPPSASYDVDSVVMAYVVPHMALADDLGPHDDDLITSGTTQDLMGAIIGHMETGQRLELKINGTAVPSDSITITTLPSEGTLAVYAWVYHGPVPAGANTVEARVVDSTGHSSVGYTSTVVIDNTAPAMTSTASGSTDFNPANTLVINFSEPVFWHPSEGSDSMIEVRDGDNNVTHVAFSLATLSADGRTLSIPATAHHFGTGTTYHVTMPATLTDIGGNGLGSSDISLHTSGTFVDTTPPRALSATVVTPGGSYGVGEVIEIHVAMNENVAMVASAVPTLVLNNGATATFVALNAANELVFEYDVRPEEDVAMLEVTDWTSLVNSVADLAGNKLDASHIEFTHLVNPSAEVSGTSGIEIDTTRPAAMAAPVLSPSSDSATAGDNITNIATPALSGSGAEPGNVVFLIDGETRIATLYADGSGHWSYTPASDMANGTHTLSVRQQDSAGNYSTYSGSLTLKIDTVVNAPTLALDAASDTGTAGDNITKQTTPTIKGSAEAGARVDLYDGSTLVGTTTANGTGDWSIVTPALAEGAHTFTAKQTDVAGNASAASAGLVVAIDTTAPAALSAPLLAVASDGGTAGDRITNDITPLVQGSGALPGATIQLYGMADVEYPGATTTADASGNWSFEFTAPFSEGGYSVYAKQFDAAGNASAMSPGLALTFDKTVVAPNMHLEFASDTGLSDYDRITKDTTPTFTGTAEAGATVKLYAGATEVGSATANAFGDWSITTSALSPGEHSFGATQTDKAGNLSSANGPIPVTIDTTAPTLLTPTTNLLADGTIRLTFSEKIDLSTLGTVTLLDGSNAVVATYTSGSANWHVNASGQTELEITGLGGVLYKLHVEHANPADIAGNVMVVGIPDITFGLPA